MHSLRFMKVFISVVLRFRHTATAMHPIGESYATYSANSQAL